MASPIWRGATDDDDDVGFAWSGRRTSAAALIMIVALTRARAREAGRRDAGGVAGGAGRRRRIGRGCAEQPDRLEPPGRRCGCWATSPIPFLWYFGSGGRWNGR